MEDFLQDPYEEKSTSVTKYGESTAKEAPVEGSAYEGRPRSSSTEVTDLASLTAPSDAFSNINYNSHLGSPQNPSHLHPTSDPLMDQLNFLGSPLQQTNSIDQSLSADIFSDLFDSKFKDSLYGLETNVVDAMQNPNVSRSANLSANISSNDPGNANISGNANIPSNPNFQSNPNIQGYPNIQGNTNVSGNSSIADKAFLSNNANFAVNQYLQSADANFSNTQYPENAGGSYADNNFPENIFLSSQYFSPNNRGNFLSLNAIAEDGINIQNDTTPDISRHSSISLQPTHELNNSYLSPKKFMSPQANAYEGSLDTLRSPHSGSYSGSYMNSPPPMMLNSSMNATSAPGHSQTSASPQLPQLSSLPDSQAHLQARRASDAGNKQLTQEEKIKRRREFHNAVERRRRDLIKEKIKALGLLVPPSLLTPQLCAVQALSQPEIEKSAELSETLANIKIKEAKPNKAIILREAVVYIRHLQKVSEQQISRRRELESMIAALESGSSNIPSPGVKIEDDLFAEIGLDTSKSAKKEVDFLEGLLDT